MKKNRLKLLLTGLCGAAILAGAQGARAAENGVLTYPPGASAVFQNAFPPIPGIFVLSQNSFAQADALYGNSANKLPAPFKLDVPATTERFLASYPVEFLGAHLYSQLVVPIAIVNQSVEGFGTSYGGFANIAIDPLVMNWFIDKNQSFSIGGEISTPLKTKGVGVDFWTFEPIIGYRWDDPNGFVFSMLPRFMFNTENTETKYTSGSALIFDYHAGYHIQNWELGVVGAWTRQFENDRQYGVSIADTKLQTVLVGPSLSYNFGQVIVNANYQFNVYAQNASNSSTGWLNVAFPLYVPPPPPRTQLAAKY